MINFNGNSLPASVQVQSVVRSVLPEMSRQTIKIFGKAGTFGLSKDIGERVFIVEFVLINSTEAALMSAIRDLARFLYTDVPQKFIVNTEPAYYYMAMVDTATDLDQLCDEVGHVKVNFVCSQPYAIKVDGNLAYTVSAPANNTIVNNGDVPSSPIFQLTFQAPSTYIEFLNNTNKGSFRLGSAVRYTEQNPFADYTNIVNLAMTDPALADVTSLAATTNFNPSVASDGVVTATMLHKTVTIGGTSQQCYGLDATDTWGTNSGWHGAAIEKALVSDLEDYSVEIDLQMTKNNNQQACKQEIYLYGTDGSEIMKLNFNDGGLGIVNPQLWVRWNDKHPYETSIDSNDVTGFTGTNSNVHIQKLRGTKYYFNYQGITKIRIAKRINTWTVWIGKIDPTSGKVLVQDTFTMNDPLMSMNQANLHKVRMTMATYGTSFTAGMYFHTLKINQENAASYDPTQHIKYFVYTGDVLTVDMQAAKVYINGVENYTFVDPSSSFWKLNKGSNDVAIFVPNSSVDNTQGQVWLNERYL